MRWIEKVMLRLCGLYLVLSGVTPLRHLAVLVILPALLVLMVWDMLGND